ncbi:MAG: hypothetical protein ACRDYV_04435 [Acidimicrobiia bacterium]
MARLLTAWDGCTPAEATEILAAAASAAAKATERVAVELETLFARDPTDQRATPLEIVRTAGWEPTAVLAAAGLPEVVRDPFAESAWPEDRFDLVPRTLRDVDPELAAVHFAWGVAKARVLRAGKDSEIRPDRLKKRCPVLYRFRPWD